MRVVNMCALEAHDCSGLVAVREPIHGRGWVGVLELREAGEHLQK